MKYIFFLLACLPTMADPFMIDDPALLATRAPSQAVTDTDVLTYLAALSSRSSPATAAITNGIAAAVVSLKSSGLWTNLQGFYPNAGSNVSANGVNLISTNYYAGSLGTPAQTGVSGTSGDGSTFGFTTGWVMTNQNSFAFFIDIVTNGTGAGSWAMGAFDSGTFTATSLQVQNSTTMAPFMCVNYGSPNDTQNNPTFPAVFVGTRTGASTYSIYWNTTALTPLNTASATPSTSQMYVFAGRNSSGLTRPWNGRARCWGFGNSSITGSQVTNLVNIISTLNTALGR